MKKAYLMGLVLLTTACEGERIAEGNVYDAITHQPLDSVAYGYEGDMQFMYTDSTGHYYMTGPFGGCMRGCPDFTAQFSKPGYQTRIVGNPDGSIFMETE